MKAKYVPLVRTNKSMEDTSATAVEKKTKVKKRKSKSKSSSTQPSTKKRRQSDFDLLSFDGFAENEEETNSLSVVNRHEEEEEDDLELDDETLVETADNNGRVPFSIIYRHGAALEMIDGQPEYLIEKSNNERSDTKMLGDNKKHRLSWEENDTLIDGSPKTAYDVIMENMPSAGNELIRRRQGKSGSLLLLQTDTPVDNAKGKGRFIGNVIERDKFSVYPNEIYTVVLISANLKITSKSVGGTINDPAKALDVAVGQTASRHYNTYLRSGDMFYSDYSENSLFLQQGLNMTGVEKAFSSLWNSIRLQILEDINSIPTEKLKDVTACELFLRTRLATVDKHKLPSGWTKDKAYERKVGQSSSSSSSSSAAPPAPAPDPFVSPDALTQNAFRASLVSATVSVLPLAAPQVVEANMALLSLRRKLQRVIRQQTEWRSERKELLESGVKEESESIKGGDIEYLARQAQKKQFEGELADLEDM